MMDSTQIIFLKLEFYSNLICEGVFVPCTNKQVEDRPPFIWDR